MRSLTIAAVLLATTAFAADPPYRFTDLDRARETTFAMLSWKTALDAYATDHGAYPDVTTLEDARAAVEPRYIFQAPMHDAWGTKFSWERDPQSHWRIISAGKDRKFAPESWTIGGQTSSFTDDAIVAGDDVSWLVRYWDLRDKCSQ